MHSAAQEKPLHSRNYVYINHTSFSSSLGVFIVDFTCPHSQCHTLIFPCLHAHLWSISEHHTLSLQPCFQLHCSLWSFNMHLHPQIQKYRLSPSMLLTHILTLSLILTRIPPPCVKALMHELHSGPATQDNGNLSVWVQCSSSSGCSVQIWVAWLIGIGGERNTFYINGVSRIAAMGRGEFHSSLLFTRLEKVVIPNTIQQPSSTLHLSHLLPVLGSLLFTLYMLGCHCTLI